MAKIKAIVRGPEDFFDGAVLNPPGSIVEVDEALVSEEDYIEDTIDVTLKEPILKDGVLHRYAKEQVRRRVMFRPLDGVAAKVAAAPTGVVNRQPDRLNVTDFLKGGVQDIADKIEAGEVDDFLDAIAMAESQGKGRKGVTDAIAERMSKA